MRIFDISFAYLFWFANNKKKAKNPEFCMGYNDQTCYVGSHGSGGQKYYQRDLSSPNAHI